MKVNIAVNTYEKTLNFLLIQSKQLNPFDFDDMWIEKYQEIIKDDLSINKIPLALALIHPDFYYRKGKSFHKNSQLLWIKNNNFKNGILRTNSCQFIKCAGYECIFNESKPFRIEADHFWPNSLGGPSILSNRLLLCSFHNTLKSNSYLNFDWETVPSWLSSQLKTIYSLKR